MGRIEDAFQRGYEDGKRAELGSDPWKRTGMVGREAVLGELHLESMRLELRGRYFCTGVPIVSREEAARHAKATRDGVYSALKAGLFLANNERIPFVTEFIQERLAPIISDGEWFDFGTLKDGDLHNAHEQWKPFAREGLIDMPFPKTVFRVRYDIREKPKFEGDYLDLIFAIDQPDIGGTFTVCCMILRLSKRDPIALMNLAIFSRQSLQAFALAHDAGALGIFPLWLILNTKGVPKIVETPPEKLNLARVKAGKSPLKPFTRVDAQAYVTALRETERMESEGGVGHHASPKPHLRRAHLRHLASGKIIPVMGCIVNGSDALKIAQREKYIVQKGVP